MRSLMRLALAALLAAAFAAPAARPAMAQEDDNPALEKISDALNDAAETLTKAGKEKDAEARAKLYDEALAIYAQIEKDVDAAKLPGAARGKVLQLVYYNSACAHSLKGEKEKALDDFSKALDDGFYEWEHIAKDTDLDPIRDEPRFKELVAKHMEKSKAETADEIEREKKEFLAQISADAAFPFDFSLQAIDGKPVSLADYKGKVLLVDVWGTWCPPCRKEIPHLVELHKRLSAKGFDIVGLNCERVEGEEARELVKKFVAENKMPYRCALADESLTKKIPDFEGFPTMLLIDRRGRVRLKQVGYTEAALLEAGIQKLLAEGGEAEKKEEKKGERGEF
jgi:thiol-disulfide isomerase/thioredoxin